MIKVKKADKSAMFWKCYMAKPMWEATKKHNIQEDGIRHDWKHEKMYAFDGMLVLMVTIDDYDGNECYEQNFYILNK